MLGGISEVIAIPRVLPSSYRLSKDPKAGVTILGEMPQYLYDPNYAKHRSGYFVDPSDERVVDLNLDKDVFYPFLFKKGEKKDNVKLMMIGNFIGEREISAASDYATPIIVSKLGPDALYNPSLSWFYRLARACNEDSNGIVYIDDDGYISANIIRDRRLTVPHKMTSKDMVKFISESLEKTRETGYGSTEEFLRIYNRVKQIIKSIDDNENFI
jgi:hypothetical protein